MLIFFPLWNYLEKSCFEFQRLFKKLGIFFQFWNRLFNPTRFLSNDFFTQRKENQGFSIEIGLYRGVGLVPQFDQVFLYFLDCVFSQNWFLRRTVERTALRLLALIFWEEKAEIDMNLRTRIEIREPLFQLFLKIFCKQIFIIISFHLIEEIDDFNRSTAQSIHFQFPEPFSLLRDSFLRWNLWDIFNFIWRSFPKIKFEFFHYSLFIFN